MGVISVDTTEIERWKRQINSLSGGAKEQFFTDCLNELANRFLALVVPRTPAKSGVLRKGWINGMGSPTSSGTTHQIIVTNDTPYASYVEYGHRQEPGRYVPAIGKRLVASWVNGQHFQQGAEDDLSKVAPGVVQGKLNLYLRTVF